MKTNKGFTIIETLVAITILMISIVGPLTIAQKSLNASIYAKDQVIASFLAQDLMELKKKDRYESLTSNIKFETWVDGDLDTCGVYGQLYLQVEGYITVPSASGAPTKFYRCSTITKINSNEAVITVKVKWNNGTISNETVLRNNIFPVLL